MKCSNLHRPCVLYGVYLDGSKIAPLLAPLRTLCCLALVIVAIPVIGCSPYQDEQMPGTIIQSGSSSFLAYEPSLGSAVSTDWNDRLFRPSILCQSHDGRIMLESETQWCPGSRDSLPEYGYYLYSWIPGRVPEELSNAADHIKNLRSLEWHDKLGVYLAVGLVDSAWGVYTLDEDFNVLRELDITRGGVRLDQEVRAACFVNEQRILIKCSPRRVFVCDVGVEPAELWQDVGLFVLSHDRQRMLVSTGYENEMQLAIYELNSSRTISLDITGRDITNAAFSPDDRYLVMTWSTHNIGNMINLLVYDTVTRELRHTRITGAGELLWVEQPVISTYASPFGEHIEFRRW